VPGCAVMSEQGLQEGAEHEPLRGPCVEDQHGGCVVTYPYHLGAIRQEVSISLLVYTCCLRSR
jgi:hypothetical protein